MAEFYLEIRQFKEAIKEGKIIALDMGLKKIGVAISDSNKNIAFPSLVINHNKTDNLPQELADFIKQQELLAGIVIGYPFGSHNISEKFLHLIESFSIKLLNLTKKPILFYDELLTTKMANEILKEQNMNRKERHKIDDKIAASILLDDVLSTLKNI